MTKLAYILAASHSGSTLLGMLLGSHPQCVTIGEMKLSTKAMGDLSRYRCSCGEFIQECGFWHKVKDGMAARGIEFDLADAGMDYRAANSQYARRLLRPLHQGKLLENIRDLALKICPNWRSELVEIHRRNAALASAISEITGAEIVVDSSKIGLRLKYLLRNPELDVKVIRLIRDGRAVALTYMDPACFADAKDLAMRAGGMGGDRENERLPMAQAAHAWRRCIEEAENILRCLTPSQWINIHYEKLCEDTSNTLRKVFGFLGVDPQKHKRDFRSIKQHIVGNGMRLDTTSEIRLDERWRENLTEQDLRIFDDVAGEMNRRDGYN